METKFPHAYQIGEKNTTDSLQQLQIGEQMGPEGCEVLPRLLLDRFKHEKDALAELVLSRT